MSTSSDQPEDHTGPAGRRRLRTVGALLLLCALILLLTVGGVLGVRSGALRGPEFQIALGSYSLIGKTTARPECVALPQLECYIILPIPLGPPVPQYLVWFGQIEPVTLNGPNSAPVTSARGRIVLRLPVGP